MSDEILNGLINPKSIAIFGASTKPGKIGYNVLENLIASKYEGPLYPINLTATEILGIKVYPTIMDIPGPIDAAIITIPAKTVKEAVDQCGQKGVKGLIIISSGFAEVGKPELEREIVALAHSYGMRILGPNIVGILSNSNKMNASFAPTLPLYGKASLASQSGALLIAIDMATFTRRVGFDKLISLGNMSDVDFSDCVTWLDEDPCTTSISLYIEGIRDGRKFIKACRKSHKPIVALKAGISSHGAAAAASHTGSLAGAAKVYSAAFVQAGIIQATNLNNLFDRTLALSLQPPMKDGDNLLIITNGGGVGVLATDAAEKYGIPLKFAPNDVQAELRKHMPEFGSAKNPADLTGIANAEWYKEAIKYSLPHPWVNGLTVLYCEVAVTSPNDVAVAIKDGIVESGVTSKPVTVSFVGGVNSEKAMQWLVEQGIPSYQTPDAAVNSMAALREYALLSQTNTETIVTRDEKRYNEALQIIETAKADKRTALTEIEAKNVFAAYGLPVTWTKLSKTEDEAVKLANHIGYPIVMKIVSPDILHKSDAGGVKVNIKDDDSTRNAFRTIIENAKKYKSDANIHGIAIQEMAPWGTEVILGSINDPTFGPTIMFGLGGIFVEVLKDVTFSVTPVSKEQAMRMQSEIRAAAILKGVRGEAPRDRVAMADTICKYSEMVLDLADEISESDANPVLVYEEGKGVKVVDARIILKRK